MNRARKYLFATSFRERLGLSIMIGCLALIAASISGAFSLNPKIDRVWSDYYYRNEENRIRQMNLPHEMGALMVVLSNKDLETPVKIEDHVATFYFDDIGYILFGQIASAILGPLDAQGIALFHNALLVFGLLGLCMVLAYLTGNAIIAAALIAPLLSLHRLFEGATYNALSNHTIVTPLVAIFLPFLLLFASGLKSKVNGRGKGLWISTISIGAFIGATTLVRDPVGLGMLITTLLLISLVTSPWRRKLALGLALFLGYFLVLSVLPGTLSIHRDSVLGWKNERFTDYFKRPPKHIPNFTLLALIGRYPNTLGLSIVDSEVDKLLVKRKHADPQRWPQSYEIVFDKIARDVLIEYVMQHPGEFIIQRVRGALELPFVLPAITFQSRDNFAGSPWTTPKVTPLVEPSDVRVQAPEQLINVKFKYVDIPLYAWAVYVLAVLTFVIGVHVAWKRRHQDEVGFYFGFFGASVLFFVYAGARALIPWWGQEAALMFWLSSLVAFSIGMQASIACWKEQILSKCGNWKFLRNENGV